MSNKESSQTTILVVDDDPTNLSVLLAYLQDMHYNILVAQNGESALEQIPYALPDLILLDIMMSPGIDGFETCRRLKANKHTKDIPVIFMTALSDIENKIKGFEVGGVDYITKPLEHQEVVARVRTHLTLRHQQKQLQAFNVSKDTFFSVIAHDLRGPLSSLQVLTQVAEEKLETYTPDKLREVIGLQRTSIEHLSQLLENLLTWSRIQQGMIACHPSRIELEAIVARNIELLTPHGNQKQITLSGAVPTNVVAYADLNMVDTVIRNLLSNAVKFTKPGGSVEVSATQIETAVEVSVADTGIGIPTEKVPTLFRIDQRYKRVGTAREKGTGLGLILCKEFIEKNGGKIWVESEVGKGTIVRFTLPNFIKP
jgi:two-component system sensor histidine kinase/response regulator